MAIEQLRQNKVFLGMVYEFEKERDAIKDQLLAQCDGIVEAKNIGAINYINGRRYQNDFALGWLDRYEAALKISLERNPRLTPKRAGDK